jgi:hypothetical protein
MFISLICEAQQSFEGLIKFKTEVSDAKSEFKQKLIEKYGDSLIVYYSKDGSLRRQYLNSAKDGNDIQIYDSKNGILYLKNKTSTKFDSLDVKINSITKLISTKKIRNEKIMDLDCECIEFIGQSKYNQNVVINYCYNLKTPKVDYNFFAKHNDFFLNDYFKNSKRPYLKFSIQTSKFKISQLATEIKPMKIKNDLFTVK